VTRRERLSARIAGRETPLEERQPRPAWRRTVADVAVWVAVLPLIVTITVLTVVYVVGMLEDWGRVELAVTATCIALTILYPVARWLDRRVAVWRPHWSRDERRTNIIGAIIVIAFIAGQVYLTH